MIFYRLLIYTSYKRAKERGVHALFSITLGKQMSNYYEPWFYRIDFDVIPSYIELPWPNESNYGLIKEENFTIALSKNG